MKGLPLTASLPLASLRHAIISFSGFMEAKCFAASNPSPVFAPVTNTTLPVRSSATRGTGRRHCSLRNWRKEWLVMGCCVLEGAPHGLGGSLYNHIAREINTKRVWPCRKLPVMHSKLVSGHVLGPTQIPLHGSTSLRASSS